MKRVAIYARVSTDKQTCENQLIELRAVAERCGYTIVTEFVDTGISGAKGRADRPALNEMMKAATQRRFDMVLVWSIDRLGRSLQNLVELLNELQSMRIDLMFLQQGINAVDGIFYFQSAKRTVQINIKEMVLKELETIHLTNNSC